MDLFEEVRDLELNEDLPKDLAKAFRSYFATPREGGKYSSGNYGGIGRRPNVDFKNSTYTEITPEQALQLYKDGQSRNVLCLFNGQLANTYLETSPDGNKRTYDFKAEYNGGDKAPFTKANGKVGNNTMWLSPKEFYNNADKIYVADEVEVDPSLRAERAKNPESRYNSNMAQRALPKIRKKTSGNINGSYISFTNDNTKARYRSSYVDNQYIINGQSTLLSSQEYYPVDVWKEVYTRFRNRWGETDPDTASVKYIIDTLSNAGQSKNSPGTYDWSSHDNLQRGKADVRYADVATALQTTMRKGRALASKINQKKQELDSVKNNKERYTGTAAIDSRKQRLNYDIQTYQRYINNYMKELLSLQDKLDDIDENNTAEIAKYDSQIADIQDELAKLQGDLKGIFTKKESLEEGLEVITLTQEDQASNIRALIKTCWDNVDAFSMYASQLNTFGNQQALEVTNSLINDLYLAIGSFEDVLQSVDYKSEAMEAPEQVEVVAQVAPQVAQQMAAMPMQVAGAPMVEKFILSEDDPINEELEEKPEVQKVLEEPIKKELKAVEDVREEHQEDSLNPEHKSGEEELEEDFSTDDHVTNLYASLLKLEG